MIQLRTSLNHQILSVIGWSFLSFELVFLLLFFDNSWFKIDISVLGIPIMLAVCVLSYCFLTLLETDWGCRLTSIIGNGKPLFPFKKWLFTDQNGIVFGTRRISWSAIDEVELTFFGNLLIKSWVLCGPSSRTADLIFKFPFAIADEKTQKDFLNKLKSARPNIRINKRLEKTQKEKVIKAAPAVQSLGSVIMCLALLDLGYSSFYYLEVLKNYYLAETALLNSEPDKSKNYFDKAEALHLHPLAVSFASNKLFLSSGAAAGLKDLRAEIFWLQKDHKKAIEEERQALAIQDNSLKRNLRLVRFLTEDGNFSLAKMHLLNTIDNYSSSLGPRLYLISLIQAEAPGSQASKTYKEQMDACYETTFGEEPRWPQAVNDFTATHFIAPICALYLIVF